MLGAFVMAVTFIIPKFMSIFKASKMELPLPSKILMNLSIYFREYWYLVTLIVVGGYAGFKFFIKTEKGNFWWDRIKLKFPIFGQLFMKIYMSRFIRTFVSLYSSGLPIILNLEISANTFGNVYLTKVVQEVKEGVKEGGDIWERMRRSKVFPPLVYHMFAIGEFLRQSGPGPGQGFRLLRKGGGLFRQKSDNHDRTHPDYWHGGHGPVPGHRDLSAHVGPDQTGP